MQLVLKERHFWILITTNKQMNQNGNQMIVDSDEMMLQNNETMVLQADFCTDSIVDVSQLMLKLQTIKMI